MSARRVLGSVPSTCKCSVYAGESSAQCRPRVSVQYTLVSPRLSAVHVYVFSIRWRVLGSVPSTCKYSVYATCYGDCGRCSRYGDSPLQILTSLPRKIPAKMLSLVSLGTWPIHKVFQKGKKNTLPIKK